MISNETLVTGSVSLNIKKTLIVANSGTNSKIWILCPTI